MASGSIWRCEDCGWRWPLADVPSQDSECDACGGEMVSTALEPRYTPSADLPACRDEDPAHAAVLAAAYPDPPEYAHPKDRCISCGAEIDHYLGCPDDPNPDYEAEAEVRGG